MLRAISRVASPCCSIDAEMPAVISLISAMVWVMPPMAATASLVEVCIAATWAEISSVALAVWLASALTSEATTAKPRPDSPGTRRLDGGVEGEQIGLRRDRVDQLDHLA